jgi:hypothetical protein
MHDGRVRLIWQVDPSGYDIVRYDELLKRDDPEMVEHVDVFGASGAARFDKSTFGIKLAAELRMDKLEVRDDAQFIAPRGGKRRKYEAGVLEHSIFRDLVNSAHRPGPEGVREFVNKWGQLTDRLYTPLESFLRQRSALDQACGPGREDITPLLKEVSRSFAILWASPGELGQLRAHYVMKRGRSHLYFQADSLLQFCAFELLQTLDGDIDITACGACGRLLPVHKKGRPKLYCNDACKTGAWRGRHRDEPTRARRQKRAK